MTLYNKLRIAVVTSLDIAYNLNPEDNFTPQRQYIASYSLTVIMLYKLEIK